MRSLPGANTAALHPRRVDRQLCRRLLPAESHDSAYANVSRQRANVRACVRVGLLMPRTAWLRPRPRSGVTLAIPTARSSRRAYIPVQADPALVDRLIPPI